MEEKEEELKIYAKIGWSRLLNIQVVVDNGPVVYSGMVEDAPQDIKEYWYSKVEMGTPITYYVYNKMQKVD